jgi:uncharacterized protein YjbJ (UPF0337 family)
MGLGDKISHRAEELKGKVKEVTGRVTGHPKLEAEGKLDQGVAGLKKFGEHIKDAAKKLKRTVTD